MNCDQFTNSSQINNLLNSGRNNVAPSNVLNMVNEEYNSNNLGNFGNVGNNVHNTRSTSINAIRENQNIQHNINQNLNNIPPNVNVNNHNHTQALPPQNLNSNTLNNVSSGLANNINEIVTSTYQTSFQSLNLGFMLAAALAWNEAVKFFISRSIRLNRGSPYYFIYYALSTTLLAAIVFTITRKYIDTSISKPNVMYAVT
jgi:hypothetical protein